MQVHSGAVSVETTDRLDVRDVTAEVTAAVEEIDADDGLVWASTPHTSAALSTNEFEEKLVFDMKQQFVEMVPPDDGYYHDTDHVHRGEQPNAHAHILATIIDQPVLALLDDGDLQLGAWEAIMLFEFCGPREREVEIHVLV